MNQKLFYKRMRRKRILRMLARPKTGSGTTGTIPEPMMWGLARKFQVASLATQPHISDYLFKGDI